MKQLDIQQGSIGLSMIVKNGGWTLRHCLESVKGVVDQIVIADTGSTDDTKEIADDFRATVFHVPWNDHFAEARNAALDKMRTDWVLVLDADEELEPDADLRSVVQQTDGVFAYLVTIRNYTHRQDGHSSITTRFGENRDTYERAKSFPFYLEHSACRLFRRDPRIRYQCRVHELVEYDLIRERLPIKEASFRILHYGKLAGKEAGEKKNEFYRNLLRLKVKDEPNNPFAWIEYGRDEYVKYKNYSGALRALERSVELMPQMIEAWAMIADIHMEEKRFETALLAVEHLPDNEVYGMWKHSRKADLLHHLRRLGEARQAYQRARLYSEDKGLTVESKLGYVEVELGLHTEGIARLRRAFLEAPNYVMNYDRLLKAYLIVGNIKSAADVAEEVLDRYGSPAMFLKAATLRRALHQVDQARAIITRGLQHFPDSSHLKEFSLPN